MHMSPKFLAAGILATMLATAASGQVVNGDFQSGYVGWSATGCAAVTGGGGNPGACGVVQYLNTGTSCTGILSQTFNCGAAGGSCQITFDWRLDQLAGFGTAIFGMTADGLRVCLAHAGLYNHHGGDVGSADQNGGYCRKVEARTGRRGLMVCTGGRYLRRPVVSRPSRLLPPLARRQGRGGRWAGVANTAGVGHQVPPNSR